MSRSLDEVMASLPREPQQQINARYQKLKQEVEGLRELRQIAGKVQADVATALKIKQPSVSKIEKLPICISRRFAAMWKLSGGNWN